MVSRREWFGITLDAGAALALNPRLIEALQQGQLIQRAIPSSGERVPVIGLGSSATFASVARQEDIGALREVIKAMVEHGAKVFDTAPGYGAPEQVAGDIANELGVANKIFWATKVNVAGRGGGADPAAARAQIEESFRRFRVPKIDLIQVHNLADVCAKATAEGHVRQQVLCCLRSLAGMRASGGNALAAFLALHRESVREFCGRGIKLFFTRTGWALFDRWCSREPIMLNAQEFFSAGEPLLFVELYLLDLLSRTPRKDVTQPWGASTDRATSRGRPASWPAHSRIWAWTPSRAATP